MGPQDAGSTVTAPQSKDAVVLAGAPSDAQHVFDCDDDGRFPRRHGLKSRLFHADALSQKAV